MQTTADLLVRHALIITQDDQRRSIDDGALAVRGDRIVALGPTAEVTAAYTAPRVINATRARALSGAAQHSHPPLPGGGEGVGRGYAVEQWVQAVTFPTAAVITPEEAYLLALVSCLENLRSGATTVMDFMYGMRDPALHDAVIQAMLDSGLRGRYTRTIVDAGADMGIPPTMLQPAEEALAHAQALQAQYNGAGDGRLDIGLAIGVIWAMTEPMGCAPCAASPTPRA
jgi:5-methylthioadenosine/S-adenosylhomocysteine deaminase